MAQSTTKSKKPSNSPAHTIRYGAVRATVWRNIVDNGNASRPIYSVAFGRSYKDSDNNWKESSSFGADDLLLLAKIANDAHTFIHQQRSRDADAHN